MPRITCEKNDIFSRGKIIRLNYILLHIIKKNTACGIKKKKMTF